MNVLTLFNLLPVDLNIYIGCNCVYGK